MAALTGVSAPTRSAHSVASATNFRPVVSATAVPERGVARQDSQRPLRGLDQYVGPTPEAVGAVAPHAVTSNSEPESVAANSASTSSNPASKAEHAKQVAREQHGFFLNAAGTVVAGLLGLWPIVAIGAVNAIEKAVYAALKKGGLKEPTTPDEIRQRASREGFKNLALCVVSATISATCFLFFWTGIGFVGGLASAWMAFDRLDRTNENIQRYLNADKADFKPLSVREKIYGAFDKVLYRVIPKLRIGGRSTATPPTAAAE